MDILIEAEDLNLDTYLVEDFPSANARGISLFNAEDLTGTASFLGRDFKNPIQFSSIRHLILTQQLLPKRMASTFTLHLSTRKPKSCLLKQKSVLIRLM